MTIIQSTSNSPTFNLAAEEFLFSHRQDDLLFLYVNDPSVIIGCNQAVLAEVNVDFCKENDITVCRRISGGGAVFHDSGNLNFCFISNKETGETALSSDFLKPIVWALNDLFVVTEIGKRKDLWLPDGHKISGTASHVSKTRELHHGTLLYDTDLEKLQETLIAKPLEHKSKAIASVPSPVKNIRNWLQERYIKVPAAVHFFELLKLKIQQFYITANNYTFTEEEIFEIHKLQINKYDSMEWTLKK